MTIGIDARMLGPENGGLGRYVEQLVLHLLAVDERNQYVLFLAKKNIGIPLNYKNVRSVLADIPWYSISEQFLYSKIIKKEKIDLMHWPHWNVPLFYRGRFVVTIHDLIMYHYPREEASTHGPIAYWFKDRMHRLVVRHAVREAKHILITSEFTKQDIHQTLGVPSEKMTVTYQAPFKIFNFQFSIFKPILEKYGITKPYVLYVGNAYPHKNLDGLLRAWKIFEEKYGEEYQLVFVGKENFFYRKLFNNVTMEQYHNVTYTGFVSDEELSALYQSASLYVFPSLHEGFGLPPLEAMEHGVPVVSSNQTCLPEVLGEAAMYFDPAKFEQMADVMNAALRIEGIRSTLRENAKHELKRYSWETLARQTLAVYERNY